MSTITVFNQKGGVGKTITSLNLAAAMHRSNMPTLLIDMDPQTHLTNIHSAPPGDKMKSLFGFYEQYTHLARLAIDWPGIGHLIPSHRELISVETRYGRGPMVLKRLNSGINAFNQAIPVKHVILDCSPTVGVLTLGAIFAADLVLIPISSDFMALQAAKKVEKTLQALEIFLKKRVPRRYLLTRFDRRRGMTVNVKLEADVLFNEELLRTVIPLDVALAESPADNQHIYQKNSSSKGAKAYEALLDELERNELISSKNKGALIY